MRTLRRLMLSLVSAAVAFGILAGVVAWQANVITYTAYHRLVDEGSRSVDAALQARAAVLDNMGASATYLATTGQVQAQARATADNRWDVFAEQLRISWSNQTDTVQGENNVFQAADQASHDYIQQIGAMYAYESSNPPNPAAAGAEFLTARDTLNNRLVPALGGLEGVKVELMGATYATASDQILGWRAALLWTVALLALLLLGALATVWRMHYAWSWSIGLALVLTVVLGIVMQSQLATASSNARVMVHDAYDTVAGVQDLGALLSQARALESIAIFDNAHAADQLAAFDQYNFLIEQQLCGDTGCTNVDRFSQNDAVLPDVVTAALAGQSKYGLPRAPLIANVRFPNQATEYDKLLADYKTWIGLHQQLHNQLTANPQQMDAARTLSTGQSATVFARVVADVDAIRQTTRTQYDDIWQRVYLVSQLGQGLALAFPAAGLLAAWGLVRRRSELFA